jgi:serine/threonine protein kinase
MLTAQQPFAGKGVGETVAAILTREPPPMRLNHGGRAPAAVEQLARKCLQKERDRRYQTLEDLIRDLERICSSLDEGALPRPHASGVRSSFLVSRYPLPRWRYCQRLHT